MSSSEGRIENGAASKKRIAILEGSAAHWKTVFQKLRSCTYVVYWSGIRKLGPEIRDTFPECIFHDTYDAKRGLSWSEAVEPRQAFDAVCEDVWRTEAQVVYDQMSRFDHSRDLSHTERQVLFYKLLVFWRALLPSLNANLVIFPAPPHVVYDYLVLCLCRRLSVRTMIFEEATVYPPYNVVMEDFRSGPDIRTSDSTESVSESATRAVERMRGSYDTAKPAREVETANAARRSAGFGVLADQFRSYLALERQRDGVSEGSDRIVNTASLTKERGVRLVESFNGLYPNTRFLEQCLIEREETERLRRYYESRCVEPATIRQPFVYVALAGQPERTSNPQADIFCQQLLMLNMLAHAIPSGWLLVLKEHPNQFHPDFAVNMCRSIDWYEELHSLPNTRLVPVSSDPFDLIDRCAAVATTGGTSALEAAARGKPSMLFGDAWYRGCPGVTRVRSTEDIEGFLASLNEKQIPREALERFLDDVARSGFAGMADQPPSDFPVVEDAADNLAGVILSALLAERQ